MAQRKENFYNPLDFEKDVAIGITLPFGKNKGLFSLSYTTEEQSISNLKNLLLTRKGERLFQPEFGSDVYSLMFEQMDEDRQHNAGCDTQFNTHRKRHCHRNRHSCEIRFGVLPSLFED